jgi:hypothetical protein
MTAVCQFTASVVTDLLYVEYADILGIPWCKAFIIRVRWRKPARR